MNRTLLAAALSALALAAPVAVQAQQLPPAVVAVVDSQNILQQCTVCQAANQALQQQQQRLQQRAVQLGLLSATPNTPSTLEAEGQAIQTALNALPQGQQPDAALQTRFRTLQTNTANARREIAVGEEQIRRNQAFILQQIQQRVAPAIQQIAQQRGVTVVLDAGNIAWNAPAVDITSAVVAVVNQNTAALNVNAPPPQQQQPQPTQQPQQNRPRPQGR